MPTTETFVAVVSFHGRVPFALIDSPHTEHYVSTVADQEDVRRIALSLPETSEEDGRFAFSVLNKGKPKGIAWVWLERVEPKKPRVPRPDVLAIRVANSSEKKPSSRLTRRSSSPNLTTTGIRRSSSAFPPLMSTSCESC